jgi:hypothetical protein
MLVPGVGGAVQGAAHACWLAAAVRAAVQFKLGLACR